MRFVRALWAMLFLVPLSWWADSGCRLAGVDPLYHTTRWVHERLGWFVAALAVMSAAVVVAKIVVARRRFTRLKLLAEPFDASTQLGIAVPTAVALPLSHATFRHDLPYLVSHHCQASRRW